MIPLTIGTRVFSTHRQKLGMVLWKEPLGWRDYTYRIRWDDRSESTEYREDILTMDEKAAREIAIRPVAGGPGWLRGVVIGDRA